VKVAISTALAVSTLLVAAAAHADVAAQAQILPSVDGNTDGESYSLGTGYAVAAQLGARVTPNLSVEFAPRYAFGMKAEGDDEDWGQIDLAVRLTGHLPLQRDKSEVFGFVAPGYSMIFLPKVNFRDLEIDDPTGPVLGFGAGAAYTLWPTLELVGDVGYSWGFQSTTVRFEGETSDADLRTRILHVGVGIRGSL
jgi:hypothetical protein